MDEILEQSMEEGSEAMSIPPTNLMEPPSEREWQCYWFILQGKNVEGLKNILVKKTNWARFVIGEIGEDGPLYKPYAMKGTEKYEGFLFLLAAPTPEDESCFTKLKHSFVYEIKEFYPNYTDFTISAPCIAPGQLVFRHPAGLWQ